MSEQLIEKFKQELNYRLSIKETKRNSPSKILLEGFKYYDLPGKGLANYNMFLMVVKIRLGINIFNEEQFTLIFNYFLSKLPQEENKFYYRDFVT